MYGISFAGHDPVTALLCNTLRCLLPRREQWDALCADPSLAAAAVEEETRLRAEEEARLAKDALAQAVEEARVQEEARLAEDA